MNWDIRWQNLSEEIAKGWESIVKQIQKRLARFGDGGWPTRDQTQDEEC